MAVINCIDKGEVDMNGAEIQATWFIVSTAIAVITGAVLVGILNMVSTEKEMA